MHNLGNHAFKASRILNKTKIIAGSLATAEDISPAITNILPTFVHIPPDYTNILPRNTDTPLASANNPLTISYILPALADTLPAQACIFQGNADFPIDTYVNN
jgi:hypothetical protein